MRYDAAARGISEAGERLIQPYRDVDGEHSVFESLQRNGLPRGVEELPEPLHSHYQRPIRASLLKCFAQFTRFRHFILVSECYDVICYGVYGDGLWILCYLTSPCGCGVHFARGPALLKGLLNIHLQAWLGSSFGRASTCDAEGCGFDSRCG